MPTTSVGMAPNLSTAQPPSIVAKRMVILHPAIENHRAGSRIVKLLRVDKPSLKGIETLLMPPLEPGHHQPADWRDQQEQPDHITQHAGQNQQHPGNKQNR